MSAARILIVDDDPVTRAVFQKLLAKESHTVSTSDQGRTALEMVRADPLPDLVILDVVLPDIDGVSVCRQIKGDPRTEHIPVLLVSAYRTDDTSIRNGLDAGAEGYLLKPIDDVALRAWVKAALRISGLRRALTAQIPGVDAHEDVLMSFAKLSHAVNNPLQALYASVDILSLSVVQDPESSALIVDILHHAERVAQLVAQASLQARDLLKRTSGGPDGSSSP